MKSSHEDIASAILRISTTCRASGGFRMRGVPAKRLGWSGWVYFSLSFLTPIYARMLRRNLARLPAEPGGE
jgi:hypothetical protein